MAPETESPSVVLNCAALLFDMDGVLVDSTPAVARVWSAWARERGFDPDDVVRRAHGRPSITTIRELLPEADHEAEDREVERREIEDVADVVPIRGVLELLKSLPRDSWTLVTSATRPLTLARLRAAGIPVPEEMITASDIKNGKPHPEPYLSAALKLGVKPPDCIVVEDAPAGIRSGVAAGARVIALSTTVENPAELIAAGARWVLKDCASIKVEPGDGSSPVRLRLTR